ncbi:MAG: Hsp20/alpha crystallin family protein [Anaerolineales bacterium]|nr:Hsp20/alpha crystallin family protein [Anaerolineales bacterium]
MSGRTGRDPFRQMLSIRSKLDRRLEDWERPSRRQARVAAPPLNLLQTPEDFIVRVKLPRVKPEDIENSVTGDALNARGEIESEQEKDNCRSPLRELRHGSSARSVALPAPPVGDKAQARFQDGVRTLALPKAERVRPKMIPVKAA